jgi:general L-amino acid transport system permease protein
LSIEFFFIFISEFLTQTIVVASSMFKQKTTEQLKAASRPTDTGAHAFYNNPKYRAMIYQALLIFGLGYFFYAIVSNTLANLQATGVKSGFGFLSNAAGYDVLMTLIPFESTDTYLRVFIVGFLNTLLVSFLGIVFATMLGFLIGVMYFSKNWLIKKLSIVYVETFRNIPLLLQILFWYSAVLATLPGARESLSIGQAVFLNVRGLFIPGLIGQGGSTFVYIVLGLAVVGIFVLRSWAKKRQDTSGQQFPVFNASVAMLIGLPFLAALVTGFPFIIEYPVFKGFGFNGGISVIPELMALTIALSVYTGAFIAEAVRAGIQAVPHGQTEAARSIGLKEKKIMSLIVVPQAMRVIVPLLNSEYQSLVKNSTLAAAIAYPDLFNVFVGTALNQTGQAIETIFMAIVVYFAVNMLISFIMNSFNNNVELVGR